MSEPIVPSDPAQALQARLRDRLKMAMRDRSIDQMKVLRALIAAVDDAQAVPMGEQHERYQTHTFGAGTNEVPRLSLDANDLRALLERERDQRLAAAAEYDRLNRPDAARALRQEAAVAQAFLD